MAIQLSNGQIITGKTTSLLSAPAAALLNALKILAEIKSEVHLISESMVESFYDLKSKLLGNSAPHLNANEVLIALSICTTINPTAQHILRQIPKLRNSEAHSTAILPQADINIFHKLGVNITCEPGYKKIAV